MALGHGVVGLPISGGMCNKTFYIHTCIKRFFILLEVCLFTVLVTTGCTWTIRQSCLSSACATWKVLLWNMGSIHADIRTCMMHMHSRLHTGPCQWNSEHYYRRRAGNVELTVQVGWSTSDL